MPDRPIDEQEEHFWSLVHKPVSKSRKCKKCSKQFKSAHYGNRFCASCIMKNKRAPARMAKLPIN